MYCFKTADRSSNFDHGIPQFRCSASLPAPRCLFFHPGCSINYFLLIKRKQKACNEGFSLPAFTSAFTPAFTPFTFSSLASSSIRLFYFAPYWFLFASHNWTKLLAKSHRREFEVRWTIDPHTNSLAGLCRGHATA